MPVWRTGQKAVFLCYIRANLPAMTNESAETRFHGVGVSPGIARGNIQVMRDELEEVDRYSIEPSQVSDEIARFETALMQTRMQILEMQQQIAEAIGAKDAGIFDAHLLVVEDRTLIDEVLRKLEADHCNVEAIFQEVREVTPKPSSKIDDPYLRERALDIQDVTRRVVRNLQGKAPQDDFSRWASRTFWSRTISRPRTPRR